MERLNKKTVLLFIILMLVMAINIYIYTNIPLSLAYMALISILSISWYIYICTWLNCVYKAAGVYEFTILFFIFDYVSK